MSIYAIADLHLSFSCPEKKMDVFGPAWERYTEKIQQNWERTITDNDLVLIAGDISWAKKLDQALIDLAWIDKLPGQKVILRGNHDYWWDSLKKLQDTFPPSIHPLHNNSLNFGNICIAGGRLWDTPEYSFNSFVEFRENPKERKDKTPPVPEEIAKTFEKELSRLRLSLESIEGNPEKIIVMTHYPPISHTLAPSRASSLLEEFHVDTCVFGHLHNIRQGSLPFGKARGINYHLTSCDYLNFVPLKIW